MKGRLIVLEGTDGSGKATQSRLLSRRLHREGAAFRTLAFPRYGKPSAALAEEYLAGGLGRRAGDVNAYAASLFFSMDRYASYRQDWGAFYEGGGLVIADRYTTSNAVHQASKLPEEERQGYLDWLFDTEYRLLGLPRPDLVVYLDLPPEVSGQLLHRRQAAAGTAGDIHEQDAAYLSACRETARAVAERCAWQVLRCEREGALLPPEEIHRAVWQLAEPFCHSRSSPGEGGEGPSRPE